MRKHLFSFFCAFLCVLVFLPMTNAAADEFSGSNLSRGWRIVQDSAGSKYTLGNGVLRLINGDGALQDAENDLGIKALRPQLVGDWTIETQITDLENTGENDGYGLILYADGGNYAALVRSRAGVRAYAVEEGQMHVLAEFKSLPTRHNFLRIRKITRLSAQAAYAFYTSDEPVHNWNYIGEYAWKSADALEKAEYGLVASGGSEGRAVFDFFSETVREMNYDDFNTENLDEGFWRQSAEATVTVDDMLKVQLGPEEEGGTPAFLLRDPLREDWIIDTRLLVLPKYKNVVFGLAVERENASLFFGTSGTEGVRGILNTDDGEKLLFSGQYEGKWLRMTKDGRHYEFEITGDGTAWEKCGEYVDETGLLDGASYGLGCLRGQENVEIRFDFFRERQLPQGKILGVEQIKEIGQMIGRGGTNQINETVSGYDVGGSDLGSMVDAGDKVYMFFGDTFSDHMNGDHWRSNTLAVITDTDPSDGLTIDTFITDESGNAKELITARHRDYDEVTCIPTNGVMIDGRMYYHFFSTFHWGADSHWDCGSSALAYSDDGGKTFIKAPPFWGKDSNFMHVSILEEDGYIYTYGVPSGRFGAVKLMRVPRADILVRDAYRYYAGKNELGEDLWVESEYDAVEITPKFTGELSVVYNEAIDRYMMIYIDEETDDILLRESQTITGPWSSPVTLVDHNIAQYRKWPYGPYALQRYVMEDGSFYFIISKGTYYCVFLEYAQLRIRP